MASEIEVVHAQREAQSDAAAPVEDRAAGSLVRSGALAENLGQAPVGTPKPSFKNSRQLAAGLGLSFALLIAILLGTAYLTLHRMQRLNASTLDALNDSLVEARPEER